MDEILKLVNISQYNSMRGVETLRKQGFDF
jgi:hypothetical protein